MGLYSYLGGNQVKCFSIPNMIINSNGDLEIYGLEGDFTGYKKGSKVPYKTLYYNYGENFLILDYRGVVFGEIPLIHIIKNGKYFKTVEYQKLTEKDFINKVIDKYGNSININEYSDISNFIEDYKLRDANSTILTDKYNKELDIKCYSISDLREKKVSSEQLIKDLDKRKIVLDKVTKEVYIPFSNKWFIEENEEQIIGYILYCYDNLGNKEEYFCKLSEYFNKLNYSEMVEKYLDWANSNNIEVDIEKLRTIGKLYVRSSVK
jgi:hypothetical protein